jgi:hypothetical protein
MQNKRHQHQINSFSNENGKPLCSVLIFSLTNIIMKILKCTLHVHGELNTKMRLLTHLYFGFHSSDSKEVIKHNCDQANSLKEGSSFVFKVRSSLSQMTFLNVRYRIGHRRLGSTRPNYCKMLDVQRCNHRYISYFGSQPLCVYFIILLSRLVGTSALLFMMLRYV